MGVEVPHTGLVLAAQGSCLVVAVPGNRLTVVQGNRLAAVPGNRQAAALGN